MSPAPPPGPAARPSAADIDAQIRELTAGRVVWSREALAEWRGLVAAFVAAQRDEERLQRGDVAEVA